MQWSVFVSSNQETSLWCSVQSRAGPMVLSFRIPPCGEIQMTRSSCGWETPWLRNWNPYPLSLDESNEALQCLELLFCFVYISPAVLWRTEGSLIVGGCSPCYLCVCSHQLSCVSPQFPPTMSPFSHFVKVMALFWLLTWQNLKNAKHWYIKWSLRIRWECSGWQWIAVLQLLLKEPAAFHRVFCDSEGCSYCRGEATSKCVPKKRRLGNVSQMKLNSIFAIWCSCSN